MSTAIISSAPAANMTRWMLTDLHRGVVALFSSWYTAMVDGDRLRLGDLRILLPGGSLLPGDSFIFLAACYRALGWID